jgi:hypothetical protein
MKMTVSPNVPPKPKGTPVSELPYTGVAKLFEVVSGPGGDWAPGQVLMQYLDHVFRLDGFTGVSTSDSTAKEYFVVPFDGSITLSNN